VRLEGQVVVVTGGAGGIGAALSRRFAAEGATVVVTDLDGAGAAAVASSITDLGGGAHARQLDVRSEQAIGRCVDEIEAALGPIGLWCSNAGVAFPSALHAPDDVWFSSFEVNVMAHVWAARYLVPRMVERGGGYFLATASAAGLLTNLGNAPYAVTKHGAVAYAEWLSITFGDQGIKVSCLCPQGVDTRMVAAGNSPEGPTDLAVAAVLAGGALLAPDDVAEAVVRGLETERFLILPHPEVAEFERRRATDRDRWLAGMRSFQRLLSLTGKPLRRGQREIPASGAAPAQTRASEAAPRNAPTCGAAGAGGAGNGGTAGARGAVSAGNGRALPDETSGGGQAGTP